MTGPVSREELPIRPFLRFAGCAAVVCLGGCLFSSCSTAVPRYESAAFDSGTSGPVRIPLRFESGYPYIVLDAGKNPVELFLDTGAAGVAVALPSATVRRLGLAEHGKTRTLKTNIGKIRYQRTTLPEARLGKLVFLNLECDRCDSALAAPFSRRGLFGLALIRGFQTLIDYSDSTIEMFRHDARPACLNLGKWERIPFEDDRDGMIVRLAMEGIPRPLKWLLDTGAIALNPEGTRYYNLLKSEHFKRLTGAGEREGRAFVENRTLSVGSMRLDSLNFLALDFKEPGGVDGFLGADFFMKYRVLVDFKAEVLWIQAIR
jgi:hypothetical protein